MHNKHVSRISLACRRTWASAFIYLTAAPPHVLQIQMRDIPGFVETRQQILQLKPNSKPHWISYAVAHHLNKSYGVAISVLGKYEDTLEEVSCRA